MKGNFCRKKNLIIFLNIYSKKLYIVHQSVAKVLKTNQFNTCPKMKTIIRLYLKKTNFNFKSTNKNSKTIQIRKPIDSMRMFRQRKKSESQVTIAEKASGIACRWAATSQVAKILMFNVLPLSHFNKNQNPLIKFCQKMKN